MNHALSAPKLLIVHNNHHGHMTITNVIQVNNQFLFFIICLIPVSKMVSEPLSQFFDVNYVDVFLDVPPVYSTKQSVIRGIKIKLNLLSMKWQECPCQQQDIMPCFPHQLTLVCTCTHHAHRLILVQTGWDWPVPIHKDRCQSTTVDSGQHPW